MNTNRDSFDRFGDDLCEVILSYLPLSDCFRLQCVNKQFNHLIYNNQTRFALCNSKTGSGIYNGEYDNAVIKEIIINFNEEEKKSSINHNLLKYVLKKCVNITHLVIDCDMICNETIHIISNACNRVKHLVIFAEYYGYPNLSPDDYWTHFVDKSLKNLETLRIHDFGYEDLTLDCIITILQLCPKLKAIHGVLNCDYYFDRCFEANTVFGTNIDTVSNYGADESFIKFVDHFKYQLKSLSVGFICGYDNNSIELLKLIGLKCKRLKVLNLETMHPELNEAFNDGFKSIEKLIIAYSFEFKNTEFLKKCVHLIHLGLSVYNTDGSVFQDIHVYLPQLKSIDLNIGVYTEEQILISRPILKHLAKMTNLCDLKIGNYDVKGNDCCDIITDDFITFIDNCLSIRRIGIIYPENGNIVKTKIQEHIHSNERKIIINTFDYWTTLWFI